MKKTLAIILSLALAFTMLTACSNSAPTSSNSLSSSSSADETTEEPVVLKFWKASIDETRNAWWEKTLAEFEKQHPNIKVEFLGIPGDASAFNQKLDMAIAGNDAPDVISSFLETTYISRGLLEPIDEYFNSWDGKSQIDDKYLAAARAMDYASDSKNLYVAPAGANVQCLYVRPDLLKEKGLNPPETWEDFFTAAEKSTDKNNGIYGYVIRGGSGNAAALEMEMFSYSGITDYFVDGVCTINDPKNVEFVEKFYGGFGTYTSEEDITKGWPEMAAQFQSGKAAMIIHNLGSAKDNYAAFNGDTNQVLAVPYPISVTGKRVLPSSRPTGNMMMASSEHKKEAWTLMQWLLEPEQDSAYHELMSNLPINTTSLQSSWIQDVSYMKMAADIAVDPNTQLCAIPYYLPSYSKIMSGYVEPGIQNVLLGTVSAQEFLDGWAQAVQEDYDSIMK